MLITKKLDPQSIAEFLFVYKFPWTSFLVSCLGRPLLKTKSFKKHLKSMYGKNHHNTVK